MMLTGRLVTSKSRLLMGAALLLAACVPSAPAPVEPPTGAIVASSVVTNADGTVTHVLQVLVGQLSDDDADALPDLVCQAPQDRVVSHAYRLTTPQEALADGTQMLTIICAP